MIRAGLTGNIGSGKTTVARIFETLGAAVFNADTVAKEILSEQTQQNLLIERFGTTILGSGNLIDRKKLAQVVFTEPEALAFINKLIHPLVRQRFATFCEKQMGVPCCIYEAAVLIETGFYQQLDTTIMVAAPEEIRIQRVMDRDNTNAELVRQRMKNQWPEELKLQHADYIIINDNRTSVLKQCLETYKDLTTQSARLEPGNLSYGF